MAKNIVVRHLDGGHCVHHAVGRGDEIHRRYGLWIIGGSTNRIRPGTFNRPFRSFDFYNLSHFLQGSGKCAFKQGGERVLEPGDCVTVTPGVEHIYGSGEEDIYLEDTLKFQAWAGKKTAPQNGASRGMTLRQNCRIPPCSSQLCAHWTCLTSALPPTN